MAHHQAICSNAFTNSASSGCHRHLIIPGIACTTIIVLLRKLHDLTKTTHPGAAIGPFTELSLLINSFSHFRSPTGIRCNLPQGPLVTGRPRQNCTELQDTDQRIEMPLLAKGPSPRIEPGGHQAVCRSTALTLAVNLWSTCHQLSPWTKPCSANVWTGYSLQSSGGSMRLFALFWPCNAPTPRTLRVAA